jgi:hypothetical protein
VVVQARSFEVLCGRAHKEPLLESEPPAQPQAVETRLKPKLEHVRPGLKPRVRASTPCCNVVSCVDCASGQSPPLQTHPVCCSRKQDSRKLRRVISRSCRRIQYMERSRGCNREGDCPSETGHLVMLRCSANTSPLRVSTLDSSSTLSPPSCSTTRDTTCQAWGRVPLWEIVTWEGMSEPGAPHQSSTTSKVGLLGKGRVVSAR